MEQRVVVVAVANVLQEVRDRCGRVLAVEFERDVAVVRVQDDHAILQSVIGVTTRADLMTTRSTGTSVGNGPPAPVAPLRDLVDDVHAGDDLAEHRVAVALRIGRAEIEPLVVADVDEELRRRGVRIARARHRDGAGLVRQPGLDALLRLDRDRRSRRAFAELRVVAAALDHEALDDAMELRAVVLAGLDVFQEVLDGLRRCVRIELELDRTGGRVDLDLRIGGECGTGGERHENVRPMTTDDASSRLRSGCGSNRGAASAVQVRRALGEMALFGRHFADLLQLRGRACGCACRVSTLSRTRRRRAAHRRRRGSRARPRNRGPSRTARSSSSRACAYSPFCA